MTTDMPIVACVWVKGHVDYPFEYVRRLYRMALRWMDEPFEFVVLTDRPDHIPSTMVAVEVPPAGKMFAWWRKLELFGPRVRDRFPGRRLVYLDLDVLVVSSLAPIVRTYGDLSLIPHPSSVTFRPRAAQKTVHRYNSSVISMDVGARPEIWDLWREDYAKSLWGDQDWIATVSQHYTRMPLGWFPRISEIPEPPQWPRDAKVVLMKKPKNLELLGRYEWMDWWWGGERAA